MEISKVNEAIKIIPSSLGGEVKVPSSKSIGHRLLICAALAQGESRIDGINMSKDIQATIKAVSALGGKVAREENSDSTTYLVNGIQPREDSKGPIEINCYESGSTLRFFLPVSLALCNNLFFTGEGRLTQRPINEYFPIFEACQIEMNYSGQLPIGLKGSLKAGHYHLSGNVSSQYTTGMLLAAPLLNGDTEISIVGEMESKGYIDLTLDAMKLFGVHVERQGYQWFLVKASERYKPAFAHAEGDFSQGAFWIVAGIIGNKAIGIKGLNPKTVQGDGAVLSWVAQMGGKFVWEEDVLKVYPSKTKGIVIDGSQCPDLIPIMCVLAALSEGETRVIKGERLRVKESDRILSTVTELSKLGADIVETEDGMIIRGKSSLRGGCELEGWNDHRIVMAIAIATTVCEEPVTLKGHEAIQKSYPDFFKDFISLGGALEL